VSDLKDKIKEIADIAASLPENLQHVCFELLLKHHLAALTSAPAPKKDALASASPGTAAEAVQALEETTKGQADLMNGDLHVKARRFMEKYSVSLAELNNLFYKEGEQILPLYEDLKTTRVAEAQVRIALLLALRSGLTTGEFEAQVEAIRAECRDRKTYDQGNFAANIKNNQSLFDFDTYTKDTTELRLSENGRKELAQLIKEMQ